MPRLYENHSLSGREQQVIELAGKGFTDLQIAHELGISESTVTTYWDRIRLKYGAHHRTELVLRVSQERCQEILARMRAENERLLVRIKESGSTLLHEILDDLEEPVILVDPNDRIRLANPPAALLFGYSTQDLVGRDHACLVPVSLREIHRQSVAEYHAQPVAERMDEHVEVWALHRTGKVFQVQASLTPLHTAEGILVMCRLFTGDAPPKLFTAIPTVNVA